MVRLQPVLLAALVVLGCAEKKPEKTSEDEPRPPRYVTTFNAGLARNYVPHVDARRAAIIAALRDLDSDAVCLQEVWEDRDADAVTAGVKARFPHAFRVATTGEAAGGPACTADALKPLGECVSGPCVGAEDLPGCVMKTCAMAFLGLPGGCRSCLAANLSRPMEEALAACTGGGGSSLAYDGRNGLLLLSRHPLEETSHLVLDSFLLRRAALHAMIRVGGRDVDLFCTHLTAYLPEVEYQGPHGSWEGEQARQIDQVVAWVEEIAPFESAVLMGDMNCGPANAEWEVAASAAQNFRKLVAAGFRSPYTEDHGHCTWCGRANPLIRSGPELRILDHVLFRRFGTDFLEPERILDDVLVETASGEVPLSDHFGVRVSFGEACKHP